MGRFEGRFRGRFGEGSAIPEFKVVDEAVPSHSIWGALMTPCTSTLVRGGRFWAGLVLGKVLGEVWGKSLRKGLLEGLWE